MTEAELNKRYFDWMYSAVCGRRSMYRRLMRYLHERPFDYILSRDGNRAEDGINLRYRFGYENNIPEAVIANMIDTRPCSVFEMMVALAKRCEEQIMDNPEFGNRESKWFWDMIINLGLNAMSDDNFDERYVEEVVDRLLNREYDYDGTGGLFTIPDTDQDLRGIEIWYQLTRYLTSTLL